MIIIPDVHGRDFWRKPVEENAGKDHILFLGDYLDPYPYEGIASQDIFPRLEDIIALKKEHPETITLLLGNHDLHYINNDIGGSRYDYEYAERNRKFFLENACLFQIAFISETDSKKILFTHAGLKEGWLRRYESIFATMEVATAVDTMNAMWNDTSHRDILMSMMADIPYSRWGRSRYGSPVWNDIDDMDDDIEELPGWYQVFGHSQQRRYPIIGRHFACLDCRRVFRLTEDGTIDDMQKIQVTIDDARMAVARIKQLKQMVDEGMPESEISKTELKQLARILSDYKSQTEIYDEME